MGIFFILSAGFCASPLVYRGGGWFFPYSFLGFTLFFLSLLGDEAPVTVKIPSLILWFGAIGALFTRNPLWYQGMFSLFLMIQSLNYGFRSSRWYAQAATLMAFFAFLLSFLHPFVLYVAISALVFLLLIARPGNSKKLKGRGGDYGDINLP